MANAKALGKEPKQGQRQHVGTSTRRARNQSRRVEAQSELAEHARVIRDLNKRAIQDIIEIGRRLTLAKERVGHGNWAAWLETEFSWSESTALNFMRVFELAEELKSKNVNFTDSNIAVLDIALSAWYALAQPGTNPEVRDEIVERAAAGETITNKTVQEARKGANGSTASGPHNGEQQQEQSSAQEQERAPAQEQEPASAPAPVKEQEPWEVTQARRWYTSVLPHAMAIVQHGHPSAKHLDPITVCQALGETLEQTIAAYDKCAEDSKAWADAMRHALALRPTPPPTTH